MPAKYVFFAFHKTFSWSQIGGTDSYMRRLSLALLETGASVEWVFYGSEKESAEVKGGVLINDFSSFSDAIVYLELTNACIITCFLKPEDRFKFAFKRFFSQKFAKVYSLSFFYPDTIFKKTVRILELIVARYAGVACVSERLLTFNSKFHKSVFYLPPIVPESYFNIGKKKLDRLKSCHRFNNILFLGRLDPRKGVNEVLDIIESGALGGRYRWRISGIYIESDAGNIEALKRIETLPDVEFFEEKRSEYSENVEQRVLSFFEQADWFLQPYKSLSSTVDLPLLLLEAQASGCVVLTTLPDRLSPYLTFPSVAVEGNFKIRAVDHLEKFCSAGVSPLDLRKMIETVKASFSKNVVLSTFLNQVSQ